MKIIDVLLKVDGEDTNNAITLITYNIIILTTVKKIRSFSIFVMTNLIFIHNEMMSFFFSK